ncbi:MAG: NADH-quinone oxidoreductase subunit A [Phycisphaeraceae bacterium]|jgi:NADH-quinone oxidoreductase subunit A|nr:NADH-quinone oxidoreductase subunit A [Phycisphaeraceae bacterium]
MTIPTISQLPTTLAYANNAYLPILLLLLSAILFAVGNVTISKFLGPSRKGKVKDATYESGVNPIGSARKRFNVRFYLIAMVFLVFDIEIIFLFPWAVTFRNLDMTTVDGGVWLGRIFFFIFTTIVAYVYGYRKGVFKFD